MTCGWYGSSKALVDEASGVSSKRSWTGLREYQARGSAAPTVCKVTLVGGDERLRRTFESLPLLLRPDDNDKRESGRRENSSLESPSKELSRRCSNSFSDSSCGGDSNQGNCRRHSDRVRKGGQEVRCSLTEDKFDPLRGINSERENVFESDIRTSCFDNHNNNGDTMMSADSSSEAMMSGGRRKLFLSTGILRLIPSHRPPLLPIAKRRHATLVTPQQTTKPQSAYADPVINCSTDFQQRLTDLAALQFETIRGERQRRAKKK